MSEPVLNKIPRKGQPIIFGEVLFDCFPESQTVLGGAPFNVAWHLQGFGCCPLMVSSVGADARGDQVYETMRAWKMDVSAVQVSKRYATGQVAVQLDNGQPSYDIVTDQAYDHIDAQAVSLAIKGLSPSMIYHGSLALRNEQSRKSLDAVLENTNAPIFLDLNLRAPWWERSLIDDVLHRATWVKLNDEELCEVTRRDKVNGPKGDREGALGYKVNGPKGDREGALGCKVNDPGLQDYARELFANCELERLIVTRGEQGAFVVSQEGIIEGQPVLVDNIIDTVGAGDAFCAVMIAGILQGWSTQATLDRALAFASAICQQQGATAKNPALY